MSGIDEVTELILTVFKTEIEDKCKKAFKAGWEAYFYESYATNSGRVELLSDMETEWKKWWEC